METKIKDLERLINKIYDELEKRVSRIKVLENNRNMLENKIKKAKESE